MSEIIVFVDENDNVIGSGTREEAFSKGIIHRISRIYLRNTKGEYLIAKRSMRMTTNPGLWGESVAGHVDEGEGYRDAAVREMREEIGVEGVELKEAGKFYEEIVDGNGRQRKRWSQVFVGEYEGPVVIDEAEVSETKWVKKDDLTCLMQKNPNEFTTGGVQALRFT